MNIYIVGESTKECLIHVTKLRRSYDPLVDSSTIKVAKEQTISIKGGEFPIFIFRIINRMKLKKSIQMRV